MFDLLPIKGGICSVDGFFCDGFNAKLKSKNRDIGFIYSDTLCNVDAIFTKNRFQSAPIKHYMGYEHGFKTNFILINSKFANALTGQKGVDDIEYILSSLKKKFISIKNPIMSSTGIIGLRLPCEKIINALECIDLYAKNSINLAKAIMTTDTKPKQLSFRVDMNNGESFNIAAVAKGAGMINPSFATMLCFITTDADVPKSDMRDLLLDASKNSFEAISVDGETSTNDSIFLLSNGKKDVYNKKIFKEVLSLIMLNLALMILKDAEGGSKVVAFEVYNAKTQEEAMRAAKALSNSLLIKTAIFGEDPNWGRVASCIGACGIECYENRLKISINNIMLYNKGDTYLDSKREKEVIDVMKKSEYKIRCDLGVGDKSFKSYGCDLGYDYIKINADYRS